MHPCRVLSNADQRHAKGRIHHNPHHNKYQKKHSQRIPIIGMTPKIILKQTQQWRKTHTSQSVKTTRNIFVNIRKFLQADCCRQRQHQQRQTVIAQQHSTRNESDNRRNKSRKQQRRYRFSPAQMGRHHTCRVGTHAEVGGMTQSHHTGKTNHEIE